MIINHIIKVLALDYRTAKANSTNVEGAEIALEAGLLQECIMDEDDCIEFISESDYGPFIGVQLTGNKGFIINYATGEITEY